MQTPKTKSVLVVIPNINGDSDLVDAVASLKNQTLVPEILIVDNASSDGSLEKVLEAFPDVTSIRHSENLGYTGGVNPGFQRAIDKNLTYVAPFNNDAVADKNWLKHLVEVLDKNPDHGIAACRVLTADSTHIDSTGEQYSTWGLPFPRGRGEKDTGQYDTQTEIFAASGAASLYRVAMLQKIGLLDQDFFAYYEDVDLSFRAQLAGWKVIYVPAAKVHHKIGQTSGKVKGFTTYQTMKNQPLLLLKNVPSKYMYKIGWRFTVAHILFYLRAISRGQFWIATKGDMKGTNLLFSGFAKRKAVMKTKAVSDEYIWSMLVHDLPPNAAALRKLRAYWWKITLRKAK